MLFMHMYRLEAEAKGSTIFRIPKEFMTSEKYY